MTLWVQNVMYG